MAVQIDSIYTILLVFMRTGAMFMVIPLFGGNQIPTQVRVLLGLLVAAMLAPLAPMAPVAVQAPAMLLAAMLYELVVGLLMGFAVQVVFATIEFAAHVISSEIGLMQELNPNADVGGGTGVGSLLFFLGLILFMASGMHHYMIMALAQSFQTLPVGGMRVSTFSLDALIHVSSQVFVVGTLMSAPFIAVNFLINVTFALLGKVAPKMNVFMTSFSFRIMAGLGVLVSTAVLLAHYINSEFEMVPGWLVQILLGR